MALQPLDPAAHPSLVNLGSRLRELSGDASYQAGRDYLRKGLVKQTSVAITTAYASVSGSTDYRVSVAFPAEAEVKVTCTCPAHRRNKFCKHVVAVCCALLETPDRFSPVEPPPESAVASKPRAARTARDPAAAHPTSRRAAPKREEVLRAEGVAAVERLLAELADGGLMALGQDKTALLANAAELTRALKLRRLGNLIMALQRAAARGGAETLDQPRFAYLLRQLCLTFAATRAHLEGHTALDPLLAEDLLGRTWQDNELEPIEGLDLLQIAATFQDDFEFRVHTAYFLELNSANLYLERQIVPVGLRVALPGWEAARLRLDRGGLYPGLAPRRFKRIHARRASVDSTDIEGALVQTPDTVAQLRQRLIEQMQWPFGAPVIATLFRPAALVAHDGAIGALDRLGQRVNLQWPADWSRVIPPLLPDPGQFALFGLLDLQPEGPRMRCLSVIGGGLRWDRGPIAPDQEMRGLEP